MLWAPVAARQPGGERQAGVVALGMSGDCQGCCCGGPCAYSPPKSPSPLPLPPSSPQEEIKMLMRIRRGQFPHLEVDPFPEYEEWASTEVQETPIINLPEPKRRFIPSKWEEKK